MNLTAYELERLAAACLLSGLTEGEAQHLVALTTAGELDLLMAPQLDAIAVAPRGAPSQTLLQWAGQQSQRGAVLLQFDVTQHLAYFAADRGMRDDINIGVAERPVDAVTALFNVTNRYAEAGVAPTMEPQEIYDTLSGAGLLTWQTNIYTILALQERWQGDLV